LARSGESLARERSEHESRERWPYGDRNRGRSLNRLRPTYGSRIGGFETWPSSACEERDRDLLGSLTTPFRNGGAEVAMLGLLKRVVMVGQTAQKKERRHQNAPDTNQGI
jgi:hypothetical protein